MNCTRINSTPTSNISIPVQIYPMSMKDIGIIKPKTSSFNPIKTNKNYGNWKNIILLFMHHFILKVFGTIVIKYFSYESWFNENFFLLFWNFISQSSASLFLNRGPMRNCKKVLYQFSSKQYSSVPTGRQKDSETPCYFHIRIAWS